MESMRRSEANSSHHPNKVAVNSLATESNKQSSGSGSLNNNKLSFNQQQQSNSIQQQQQHQQVQQNQQKSSSSSSAGSSSSSSTTSSSSSSGASTSSESKDTNFEYDDNEWDVGGIGDLIIDLDADIEKSSSTAASGSQSHTQQSQQQQQQQSQQPQPPQSQQQLSSSLSAAISGLTSIGSSGGGTSGHLSLLNANEKSPGSSSSSSSSSSPTTVSSSKSSLSSLFSPISLGQSPNLSKHGSGQGGATLSASSNSNKPGSKQSSKGSSSLKLQQSALVAQLNSTKVPPPDHQRLSSSFPSSGRSSQGNSGSGSQQQQSLQVDRHSKLPSSTTASMSSQPSGGQGAGKTATKMSIDHQATLDKGLKMKIKRTKPGTKTSEAKHEIVKAEQNGTSSSLEENSSISSNSSSGKKHNQVNTGQSVQSVPNQQATKRGSSSHRRDKTRDKTPHSREKSEHSSNSSSGSSGSSGSNNSNSSSNSHSNNSSNNDRSSSSSSSTSCSCSHELQVNGVQPSCTNISCIRNRTSAGMDQPSAVLAQRIAAASAGQTNSSGSMGGNSTGSAANLSINSSSNNSSNVFSSNNSSGNAQNSSSGTPNAPGPPKEGKVSANAVLPNHQQSAAQLSNSGSSIPSAQQQQQQQQNQSNLGPSSAVHNSSSQNNSSSKPSSGNVSISATVHHTISVAANSALAASVSNCDDGSSSPPAKRSKCDPKEMVDICVGTSVGTITEPDCLGPCEPGTSVTLEGIVWHETEGGVLVVNVTWRGKTYVGTLLDCTRHDWAPPRFCDSPTEELDSRTPKGRGKRGRSAALTPDLSNFTETRSSVHSKLRNGGAKGRGGRGVTTASATSTTTTSTTTTATGNSSSSNSSSSATNSNTPSTSPTAFLPPRPEKRKSKDESPSPVNGESGSQSSQTQSLVNPVTGLNVQISTKKCKTASPCAISPVLLECPEQDCSKKYKHANGLRYHQSHAHGSGSMDEDSIQLPESPRVVPPTTPSPAPATTPQPQVSVPTTPTVPPNPAMSNGTPSGMPTTSTTSSTTCAPSPSPVSVTTPSSQPTPVVSVSSGGGLLTTVPSSVAAPQTTQPAPPPQTPPQIPQHTIPGGSITAGISGQALSQHQQQHSLLVGAVPGSNILQNSNPVMSEGGAQPPLTPQQQQQQQQPQTPVHVVNSSMPSTPTRGEPPGKIKPGVLRFGPPSDNLPPSGQNLSSQSPLRPTPTAAMAPNSGPPSTPESAHQPNYSQPPPQGGQQQGNTFPEYSNLQESLRGHPPPPHAGVSVGKPQNYGKQKKNRKSPVPGDFDNSTSRDDVQSPAYSDISDDSTPVVEPEINDKSQSVKHQDVKKPQDGAPPQMPPLGGYGMYQFYSQQPYMVPPEHQPPKPPTSQSSLPPSSPAEYSKNKEPPLDLMTKPAQQPDQNPKEVNVPSSGGPTAPNPSKPMSHFYPFNYMPPGYSYNMDPNYGPVSMVSDETKMGQVQNQPPSIKEERIKESPSPHDHAKMSGQVRTPPTDYGKISVGLDHSQQMMPTKLIKNEEPPKQIKSEPSSHPMHPKEPPVQSLGAYPSIYQRHSMGVPPQPQQHMSREEELRRYYIYPDQRRSNPPSSSSGQNVPSSVSVKEEPPSPSQSSLQHSSGSHSQNQQNLSQMSQSVQNQQPPPQSQNSSQQKSSKSNLSSSQPSSGQKATNLIKDSKDEKESIKVKQEGQKPTMETQGPPPPPTSQYFLHPSYISPGPFGFDPGHPMYRNVLMSTGPYNTPPYHLPMARFHAPEDLSRNPGTKALDALHHAASQYYNSHKIHELSERALKSPTSGNVKVSVSSPNVSQQSGNNSGNNSNGGGGGGPGGILPQSSASGGPLNLQPPSGSMPPGIGNSGVPLGSQKGDGKSANDPTGKAGVGGGVVGGGGATDSRSPPPQRHVHTHHHTHVGLGYPMYPAPYGAAVLASQQAAAVAVINPFPPGPTK